MADTNQAVGSLGIIQRWKEFATGFHARLFGAMLYTPDGDSMADDTANALKTVGVAGTAVIGKARLVTATGDEITDDTADAVKAKLSANSGVDIGDVDIASIAAGDNNIGNVDIVSLPAGNLGQQAMAASVSVVPASNVTDATYIGDIKFGEALPEGTALLGKVGIDQTTPGTTDSVSVATAQGAGAAIGAISGAAVITDANGTLQQYLRGLAKRGNADGGASLVELKSDAFALGDGEAASTIYYPTLTGHNFAYWPVRGQAFNGSTFDRIRSIASSGAGLGVQQVGTLGELITLAASAARTDSANGTAVTGLGWRNRYIILFDLTVADTDAGDTLDVYVDVSLDGSTWLNAVHFTQIIGTDAASKRYAVLDPSAPGTAEILVTADAAAGVARPSMFGPQMRARWAIVDAGTDNASFTFSVTTYAI